MKTPHRRLQKCTWPTSLPRFNFVWKIVQAGVHDQLWQRFFWKGMWKKNSSQLSVFSRQQSVPYSALDISLVSFDNPFRET